MKRTLLAPILLQMLLACWWVIVSPSQTTTAQFTGRITDPDRAVVPEATVTVTNVETGIIRKTFSNDHGYYTIPLLQPGSYRIDIQKEGFRPVSRIPIQLHVNQTARVDFVLDVGMVMEVVRVESEPEALLLQTESTSVQNLVTGRVIDAVPNISRNSYYYASLQPGVVPRAKFNETQSVDSFGIGIDARRSLSALSVNGGQAFTNDFQLDGVSVLGSAWNEASVLPNPEGIQEVRTIINNFSAEYGRAQGIISVTTKSGANDFHGSAFHRFRHDVLNANSFANNAQGIERPAFSVHTFGGTLGGPIIRNAVFFFASYEGLRHHESTDFLRTVPTARQRVGDFSNTVANVSGVPVPIRIYDPFSVTRISDNVFRRDSFPDAVIPPSRVDPFIGRLFSFYPSPNRTADDVFNRNNFFRRASRNYGRNNINSRLDVRVSPGHSLYFAGGMQRGAIDNPMSWGDDNPFHSRGAFVGNNVTDSNPYGSLGSNFILSSTLLLNLRYGANRIVANNESRRFPDFDYDRFGIPKEMQSINAVSGAAIEFGPGSGLSPLNQTNSLHKRERQTNHNVVGSAVMSVDRWTFQMGGEYRVLLSNYSDPEESFWIWTSEAYTVGLVNAFGNAIGTPTSDQAGWGPASALLGAGSILVSSGRGAQPALAQKYFALYTQNDWKASDRLTVNLGLRWDLQPAATERFDRISAFDFQAQNPFGTPGGLAFVNRGVGRNLWLTRKTDFGPRAGLAFRLADSWVVRAGFGVTYLPTNTGYFGGPFVYGMDSFSFYTNCAPFGDRPSGVLVGRFNEVCRIQGPTRDDLRAPGLYGGSPPGRFDYTGYRNGVAQQWNVFLEKLVGADWLFSAGYSASRGKHLPVARVPLNSLQFLPPSLLELWRGEYIAGNGAGHPGTESVPNPLQPPGGPLIPFSGRLGGATISRQETLYGYPHFGDLTLQRSVGWSSYDALQLKAERHFSQGLQFTAHYTWSKSLDFTQTEAFANGFSETGNLVVGSPLGGGIDQLNFKNNQKPSLTDVPHRLVVSYVYEVPFGKGKRFNFSNRIWRALASGWQIGGVTVFQSGSPIEVTGAAQGSLNSRMDRLSGVPVEVPKNLQRWYDGNTTATLPSGRQITPCNHCFLKYSSDAFRGRVVATPDGTVVHDMFYFGSAARTWTDIRDHGLNSWNINVQRTFRPREGLNADFGAHFTNAWNHTQFFPGVVRSLGHQAVQNDPSRGLRPGMGQNDDFGTFGLGTFDPRQIELVLRLHF